jgi:hypothetical protein
MAARLAAVALALAVALAAPCGARAAGARRDAARAPGPPRDPPSPPPQQEQHPDVPGLLALRASLCRPAAAACLPTWAPGAAPDPCGGGWEGVECGGPDGRVLAVDVRVASGLVAFSEPPTPTPGAPPTAAPLPLLPRLGELSLACTEDPAGAPPPPPGGPGPLPGAWAHMLPGLRHLRVDGCGAAGPLPPALAGGRRLHTLLLPHNALGAWPAE